MPSPSVGSVKRRCHPKQIQLEIHQQKLLNLHVDHTENYQLVLAHFLFVATTAVTILLGRTEFVRDMGPRGSLAVLKDVQNKLSIVGFVLNMEHTRRESTQQST